jgi:hypothetical protein
MERIFQIRLEKVSFDLIMFIIADNTIKHVLCFNVLKILYSSQLPVDPFKERREEEQKNKMKIIIGVL